MDCVSFENVAVMLTCEGRLATIVCLTVKFALDIRSGPKDTHAADFLVPYFPSGARCVELPDTSPRQIAVRDCEGRCIPTPRRAKAPAATALEALAGIAAEVDAGQLCDICFVSFLV
jgi:hypothetical protein